MRRARPEDRSQTQPRYPGSIIYPISRTFYIVAAEENGDGLSFLLNPTTHEYLTTEHVHTAPRFYPRRTFEHRPSGRCTNYSLFPGAGISSTVGNAPEPSVPMAVLGAMQTAPTRRTSSSSYRMSDI